MTALHDNQKLGAFLMAISNTFGMDLEILGTVDELQEMPLIELLGNLSEVGWSVQRHSSVMPFLMLERTLDFRYKKTVFAPATVLIFLRVSETPQGRKWAARILVMFELELDLQLSYDFDPRTQRNAFSLLEREVNIDSRLRHCQSLRDLVKNLRDAGMLDKYTAHRTGFFFDLPEV